MFSNIKCSPAGPVCGETGISKDLVNSLLLFSPPLFLSLHLLNKISSNQQDWGRGRRGQKRERRKEEQRGDGRKKRKGEGVPFLFFNVFSPLFFIVLFCYCYCFVPIGFYETVLLWSHEEPLSLSPFLKVVSFQVLHLIYSYPTDQNIYYVPA